MALSAYGNYDVARSGRGGRKSAAWSPLHRGVLTITPNVVKSNQLQILFFSLPRS